MNVKSAISKLKKVGISILGKEDGTFRAYWAGTGDQLMGRFDKKTLNFDDACVLNERDVIKLAKIFVATPVERKKAKEDAKRFRRTFEKRCFEKNDFDSLSKNDRNCEFSDPWDWD